MEQSCLGLPRVETVPRSAQGSYRALEAEVRRAGWQVVGNFEAEEWKQPSARIEPHLPRMAPYGAEGTLRVEGAFELEPGPNRVLRVRHHRGLSHAFQEVRRQFLLNTVRGGTFRWTAMTAVPRVPLRAVRFSPDSWRSPEFRARLDHLSALGFNAVAVDAIPIPRISPDLRDEAHAAEWERPLAELIRELNREGWWTLVFLPIELDLGLAPGCAETHFGAPLCRQVPANRRRMLHRFETVVRHLCEARAIGFAITDWRRCACPQCRVVPFEEEAAYYLRAYSAVLKRFAPETEMWVAPDSLSWGLLQEIRAEIPITARFLVSSCAEGRSAPRMETPQPEEGVQIDLVTSSGEDWFEIDRYRCLAAEWDQEMPPCLLVANLPDSPWLPARLAPLTQLAFRRLAPEGGEEQIVFQLALSTDEWPDWRVWRDRNRAIAGLFATFGGDSSVRPYSPESGLAPGIPVRWMEHVETLSRGTRMNGQSHSPWGLSLPEALQKGAVRWRAESRVREVLADLGGIVPEAPLEWELLRRLGFLSERMASVLEDPLLVESLDSAERRSLENLRDYLSVLLSEPGHGRVWRPVDLPELVVWGWSPGGGA